MATPRLLVIQMLEQLNRAMRELSDADFERLMKGELRAGISFSPMGRRASDRSKRRTPASEETFRDVHSRLSSVNSRQEGQVIVGEAFGHKEDLFAFAKFLDLPVQRKDKVERIRDKIVTYTVGRRLSGEAVRGSFGKE